MEVSKILQFVKSTTGMHVYGEANVDQREAIFPALYLPKSLFPAGPTPTVTVIVRVPT